MTRFIISLWRSGPIYPDHNLVRTRAQYKLLLSMEEQYDAMCKTIDEIIG